MPTITFGTNEGDHVPAINHRWMIRRDLRQVLAIEAACYDGPWSEEDFLAQLQRRNVIGRVAEQGDKIIGFMVYELHKTWLTVVNLAVDPKVHRQGHGAAIVGFLKGKLHTLRRTRILFDVRETNLAGQLFLRSQGFRACRIKRGFYEDTEEDCWTFGYRLGAATAPLSSQDGHDGNGGGGCKREVGS